MKRCPQCGQTKQVEAFTRLRSAPDGRHGWCKDCRNAKRRTPAAREQRNAHRRTPEMRERRNAQRRQLRAELHPSMVHDNERRRTRRATDPDYRERENARRRTPERRAVSNEQKRSHAYRERRNDARRQRYAQDAAYREAEKAKARLPRLAIMTALAARDGWVCGRIGGLKGCGALIDKESAEIDHIIPASKGGSDDLVNLQLLCARCNRHWSDREEVN